MPEMGRSHGQREIRDAALRTLPIIAMTGLTRCTAIANSASPPACRITSRLIDLTVSVARTAPLILPRHAADAAPDQPGGGAVVTGSAGLPAQIDGVDLAQGRRQRVLGNEALYATCCCASLLARVDAIKRASPTSLAAGDKAARRLAHTLKGTAATIGAAVDNAAARLEAVIAADDPPATLETSRAGSRVTARATVRRAALGLASACRADHAIRFVRFFRSVGRWSTRKMVIDARATSGSAADDDLGGQGRARRSRRTAAR